MRLLRLRLPCHDERSLAAQLGAHLAPGGILLPSTQVVPDGEAVRFELVTSAGEALFSGEGTVVRNETEGLVIRYRQLTGPERAVLDRLLLHRDGVANLGLPQPLASPAKPVADAAPAVLAIEIGGTLARAALLQEGNPRLVLMGTTGATTLPAAVALDDKGRIVLGHRARAQAGITPASSIGSPLTLITLDPQSERHAAELERLPFPVRDDEDEGPIADLPMRSAAATELFAAVAHELRDRAQTMAGRPLTEAHLVCSPVHHPRVRHLLMGALRRAGFAKVVLLDDALCVAAAMGFSTTVPPPGPLLVIDWGGTSLRVAVLGEVDGRLDVLAAGEKYGLGGATIDERIARTLMDQLEKNLGERCEDPLARQRVLEAAETARVTLASQPEARVRLPWVATTSDGRPVDLEMTLKAEPVLRTLEPALDQVLRAAQAVLESAGIELSQVHQVLLAGGQASWPHATKRLESRFPGRLHRLPDPGSTAVLGAARLGQARATKPSGPRRLLNPVSVLAADGTLLPLFEARTPLPAQASLRVGATGAGLYCPLIEGTQIAEGYLGAGRLPGATGEVEVSARLDAQGLLDLRLADREHESQVRLAIRGADPGREATAYVQRALPGEAEVWATPLPKPPPNPYAAAKPGPPPRLR